MRIILRKHLKYNHLKKFKRPLSIVVAIFSVVLIGCSTHSRKGKTPALFDTKVEAEKAAENFNCTGAHKMGDKWMPCDSHAVHQGNKKQGDHGHHNHD